MATGDIYRVAVEGKMFGNDVVNVLHWVVGASVSTPASEAVGLGMAMENDFLPAYLDLIVPSYNTERIAVRGVTTPTVGVDVFPVGAVGLRPGDPEASQIAGLLNLRTGHIGRRNYGKIYLPGVPDADVVNGVISGDYSADAVAFLADVLTITATYGGDAMLFNLVVYSRTYLSFNAVTTGFVSASPGTQRRRKIGRGS